MAHSMPYCKERSKRSTYQDSFGNRIATTLDPVIRSPLKSYTGRRIHNAEYRLFPTNPVGTPHSSSDSSCAPCSSNSYAAIVASNTPNEANGEELGQKYSKQYHEVTNNTGCTTDVNANINKEVPRQLDPVAPVNLIISNLDVSRSPKELREMLIDKLSKYSMVLDLKIERLSGNILIANVKVGSQQEAQWVISKLQHQRLGTKRITISYPQVCNIDQIRKMVVSLLQEAKGKSMPLFHLLNVLESRYHCSISKSDVYKLKDVCNITDYLNGHLISLKEGVKEAVVKGSLSDMYCSLHCPESARTRGWGEYGENVPIVFVNMSLHELQTKTDILLSYHFGAMHLLSFPTCYEMTFGEPLPMDNSGVPLEHLLSSISTVTIISEGNTKMVKQISSNLKKQELDEENILKPILPSLRTNITTLCREIVELLKTAERSMIIYTRFIPSYHHHFGRQCKVADYGFTKLQQLLDAIPHVVQVLGIGDHRLVTLAHTAQMRRFNYDLCKIMRAHLYKPVELSQFPVLYEETLQRPFNPTEYGMCSLDDLLEQLPLNTVAINTSDGVTTIQIPKKERTPEEVLKTKQFASDVVEFLRHVPRFSIAFNKFIPAYHRYFGVQCKVSDYGFTRLIELFEAIDDVVEIHNLPHGERQVRLTVQHALTILGLQLKTLIERDEFIPFIRVEELPQRYLSEYGFPLEPQMCSCSTLQELLEKLDDFIEVRLSPLGPLISVSRKEFLPILIMNVWHLLNEPPYEKKLSDLAELYMKRYNKFLMLPILNKIPHAVMIRTTTLGSYVLLTPLYRLATEIYHLLVENGGQIPYLSLGEAYRRRYKVHLQLPVPITDFIDEFKWLFVLKGGKDRQRISARIFTNDTLTLPNIPPPPPPQAPENPGLLPLEEAFRWTPEDTKLFFPAQHSFVVAKPDTPPPPGSTVYSPPPNLEQQHVHIPLPPGFGQSYASNPPPGFYGHLPPTPVPGPGVQQPMQGISTVPPGFDMSGSTYFSDISQFGPSGLWNINQAGPSEMRNINQAGPSGVRNIRQAGPSETV